MEHKAHFTCSYFKVIALKFLRRNTAGKKWTAYTMDRFQRKVLKYKYKILIKLNHSLEDFKNYFMCSSGKYVFSYTVQDMFGFRFHFETTALM
jgi:hypothetical protein